MFEKSLIYRVGVEKKVDLGSLAETLFFYGSTHLLLDRSSVIALAKLIPHDILLELFDLDIVQLSYIREHFGVITNGPPSSHDFGAFSLAGTAGGKKIKNHQEEIFEALERELGKTKETRKLAKAIADRTALHRFRGLPDKEKTVPDLVRADIGDTQFVERAIAVSLSHMAPGYVAPSDFRFRIFKASKGDYFVDTNLDFKKLNDAYHTVVPPSHSSISQAFLLCQIVDARADTFFAAYYMAEPVTVKASSDIMQLKHFEFLRRRDANAEDVELFHELVVPEFPTIREVINSGERSMGEFLKLLDEAAKFKKWLAKANPDVGLIQSYYKEVTKKSWVETLPGKAIRFVVAAGAGFGAAAAGGPAAGLSVGATNSFLLDRILKGWRPNRFIEGPYKQFVGSDT